MYEVIYESQKDRFFKKVILYDIPDTDKAISYVKKHFSVEKIISIKSI